MSDHSDTISHSNHTGCSKSQALGVVQESHDMDMAFIEPIIKQYYEEVVSYREKCSDLERHVFELKVQICSLKGQNERQRDEIGQLQSQIENYGKAYEELAMKWKSPTPIHEPTCTCRVCEFDLGDLLSKVNVAKDDCY